MQPGQWIVTVSWDDVYRLFIDDSTWMNKHRPTPDDLTKVAQNAFRKDFVIPRILAGLRQK